ncbi:T9SS type A sorting domain-containing protein [Hymenobacter baengnokdamensis]|uniref:T9SS type A sorting domain-containing protein n=1 Tax=Hymenobacter baengnokdamensis TaxID=2615203 RepID=UPI001248F8D3|nr:T9SS type A sorting domain-containing protein [Hymenobacter baengnokdamensis]
MKKLLPLLSLLAPTHVVLAQFAPAVNLQPGAVITLPAGAYPNVLALGDFTQDFRADIAVCQRGLGTVGIYTQGLGGTFTSTPVSTYPIGVGPTGLVAVSLSNSFQTPPLDLVAVSAESNTFTLLLNKGDGSGTFAPAPKQNPPYDNYLGGNDKGVSPKLLTADLNGDHWPEFIYTFDTPAFLPYCGVFRRTLLPNIALDTRKLDSFSPGFAPASVALDDFDRDGTQDAVLTDPAGNGVTVRFAHRVDKDQSWSSSYFATSCQLTSGLSRPIQVATGDLNRDYLPDLAVAQEGSASIMVFLNLQNQQFGAQVPYALSAPARQVLLTDLNGDNQPEMLVLTADNKLQVFQHTGALDVTRYGKPMQLATGDNPTTMQVRDMNGDQRPDVVVACAGDNTVRIYLNQSVLATRPQQLAGIEVYPNPATDQLMITRLATPGGPLTAVLLDALGREVRHRELSAPQVALSVADLPRGVYVLRLTAAEGVFSQRIVVQ